MFSEKFAKSHFHYSILFLIMLAITDQKTMWSCYDNLIYDLGLLHQTVPDHIGFSLRLHMKSVFNYLSAVHTEMSSKNVLEIIRD